MHATPRIRDRHRPVKVRLSHEVVGVVQECKKKQAHEVDEDVDSVRM